MLSALVHRTIGKFKLESLKTKTAVCAGDCRSRKRRRLVIVFIAGS
jgi:hypothetical protein